MKKWLSLALTAIAALGISGCSFTVQGAAVASQERCPVVGYQKLPVTSFYCRQALEPAPAKKWTAQYVTLDGRLVLYIMNAQLLDNKTMQLPKVDERHVRPYVHSVVVAVKRYPQTDIVQLEVSDTCPLEKWENGNISIDLGCSGIPLGSLQQAGLTTAQAAVVLGQAMVDDIEAQAIGNGRHTLYQMSISSVALDQQPGRRYLRPVGHGDPGSTIFDLK
jgi:hypothetical protein